MKKSIEVYVYLHKDLDNTLILSERELSEEERYCPLCKEYWDLLLVTDDIDEIKENAYSYGVYVDGVVEDFERLQEGETYDEINSRETSMYEEEW